jgi:hypothetical protein
MAANDLIQFPDQSVNDAGEIVGPQLWVDEFETYFDERIVGEIRTTLEVGLQTAPYILISCAIDFLVTFWAGADSTRTRYRHFVNTYFAGYDGEDLYRELRCRMVHNHTVGERAIICWDEPDIHKCTTGDGTVVLNLEQFFDDFIQAKDKYFAALRSSPELLKNHIRRFSEMGVLCSVDPDDVRNWIAAD